MVTLGGLQLPDLIFDNEFEFTGIRSVVEMSLSGKPIIWEGQIQGRPINLRGTDDTAWIDKSTLRTLFVLASSTASYYELDYEGEIYSVRFRNEDFPAITAIPIIARPNQQDNDYYNNLLIKLMEA